MQTASLALDYGVSDRAYETLCARFRVFTMSTLIGQQLHAAGDYGSIVQVESAKNADDNARVYLSLRGGKTEPMNTTLVD